LATRRGRIHACGKISVIPSEVEESLSVNGKMMRDVSTHSTWFRAGLRST
jgi:hypothetical protein